MRAKTALFPCFAALGLESKSQASLTLWLNIILLTPSNVALRELRIACPVSPTQFTAVVDPLLHEVQFDAVILGILGYLVRGE